MGITSSLQTGLSGLAANQSKLDVVGNNIANVNTVGFKATRLDFKTQFLQNFSFGTAPSAELGGTNPVQIGLGATTGAISRNFTDGAPQVTGVPTNLAIQGNGFFILKDVGQQVYTRDGSFQINGLNQLVSSTGQLVQGYGVDNNFNIAQGVLTDVTIPLNSLTVAQATSTATMTGILDVNGDQPSSVSTMTSLQSLYLSNGAGGIDAVNPPTTATLLTNVTDIGGVPMFQAGDVITLTGTRGTASVGGTSLTVTAATTLADLQSYMTGTLGINTTTGVNGAIATPPGVTFPATGNLATLNIAGNPGTENDLTIGASDFSIDRAGTVTHPFTWDPLTATSADGESVTGSFPVYDSLGTQLMVNVTAVLESKSTAGSTWRFFATSDGGTATGAQTQTAIGTGTLSYDINGNLTSVSTPTFTIDRTNSGADPILNVTMDFAGTNAFADKPSTLRSTLQDGSRAGTLSTFFISNDGVILGSFDNGLSRKLGQVALASFRNNQGLIDRGSNTFVEGPNSGNAIVTAPQQLSAGRLVSSALELSNVDLSAEFVQLISASTGFSASSRVITTSNQLLQELLSAAR